MKSKNGNWYSFHRAGNQELNPLTIRIHIDKCKSALKSNKNEWINLKKRIYKEKIEFKSISRRTDRKQATNLGLAILKIQPGEIRRYQQNLNKKCSTFNIQRNIKIPDADCLVHVFYHQQLCWHRHIMNYI